MNAEAWPFGDDADPNHPLTAHRIAVTSSHPMWRYLVAFDRGSEAQPTDAEVRLLVSFLDEYKAFVYAGRPRPAEQPLDVEAAVCGVIFRKYGPDNWGYRRHGHDAGQARLPLAALMDRVHAYGGEEPPQRWQAWKAAHPDVFGAGVPR